jgi:hypothetical protein
MGISSSGCDKSSVWKTNTVTYPRLNYKIKSKNKCEFFLPLFCPATVSVAFCGVVLVKHIKGSISNIYAVIPKFQQNKKDYVEDIL